MPDFLLQTKSLGEFLERVAAVIGVPIAADFAIDLDVEGRPAVVEADARRRSANRRRRIPITAPKVRRGRGDVAAGTVSAWFANTACPNRVSFIMLQRLLVVRGIFDKQLDNAVYWHFVALWRAARHILPESRYRVISADNVHEIGWTIEKVVKGIFDLDHSVYENLSQDNEGTFEQWLPIYKLFPQGWRAVVKDDIFVGYWQTAVFQPQFFEEIVKAGRLMEGTIDPLECYDIRNLRGTYSLYVISVCISNEFRNPTANRLMFNSFIDVLDSQASHGIFYNDITTNGFSQEGRATCASFSMISGEDHSHHGTMYSGSMKSLLENCLTHYPEVVPSVIRKYKKAKIF